MVNYVSTIVFVTLLLPGLAIGAAMRDRPVRMAVAVILWTLLATYAAAAVRLAAEWERAVIFPLGKLSCVKGPGLPGHPLIDSALVIETRVRPGDRAQRSHAGQRAGLDRRRAVLRVDDAAQAW